MKSNLVKITALVDVTEQTQVKALSVFLAALNCKTAPAAKQMKVVKPETVTAPTAEQVEAPTPAAEQVEAPTPAAEQVEAPATEQAKEPTIKKEVIQTLIATKVGKHRDTIKSKLTELGANNVSSLAAEHYETFHAFLTGLE